MCVCGLTLVRATWDMCHACAMGVTRVFVACRVCVCAPRVTCVCALGVTRVFVACRVCVCPTCHMYVCPGCDMRVCVPWV